MIAGLWSATQSRSSESAQRGPEVTLWEVRSPVGFGHLTLMTSAHQNDVNIEVPKQMNCGYQVHSALLDSSVKSAAK